MNKLQINLPLIPTLRIRNKTMSRTDNKLKLFFFEFQLQQILSANVPLSMVNTLEITDGVIAYMLFNLTLTWCLSGKFGPRIGSMPSNAKVWPWITSDIEHI